MEITWLGHACFLLEEEGYRLLLDPYDEEVPYPPLHVQAHEVLCSHGHHDHAHRAAAELLPPAKSPFTVRTVKTFHDDCGGAKRGENTVHILTAGGVTVAHLGDLGHALTPVQAEAIGPCDVLLVPVGGTYTLDGKGAVEAVRALKPRTAVPMHYRHAPYGLEVLDGVEPFLKAFPAEQVRRLPSNRFTVSKELPLVLALSWNP